MPIRGITVRQALGSIGIVLLLIFGAAGALRQRGAAFSDFSKTRSSYQSSDLLVLDREGRPLQLSRMDFDQRRLYWVSLSEQASSLVELLVATEDRRFREHAGVDWLALIRAGYRRAFTDSREGGSTITMQLVSLLKGESWRRNLLQKTLQITDALALERAWSKDQIIEAYLNLAPFRGELRGIAAASQGLFGKYPNGLNWVESSVLIALLRSPNASPTQVVTRSCEILRTAGRSENCEQVQVKVDAALRGKTQRLEGVAEAPFVARELAREFFGQRQIESTIDSQLQRQVKEILISSLAPLAGQNARDGAVLVVDNSSGDILAYVGNTGEAASAINVDGVQAKRSAGSTLKPFLFAAALERRLITAGSTLDDTPLNIPVQHGVYRPEDYDRTFRGEVSARSALASSLNIPAVAVLKLVGVLDFSDFLKRAGFALGKDPQLYGLSMALGSPSLSLFELVNGYRTLARGGEWTRMRLNKQNSMEQGRRVFSEGVSFIISDILSDREDRAATFGLENPLSTRFWSASKTGTSKDMTDNWCIGFTQRYTVGVWIGNFSGAPMWNVTGITGAAPVWVEVMNLLAKDYEGGVLGAPIPPLSEVVHIPQAVGKWFIKGTEPAPIEKNRSSLKSAKITYPVPGMVVALDPEVRDNRQKIELRTSHPAPGLSFHISGHKVGRADTPVFWEVARGTHRVELRGKDDAVVDAVEFVVR